MFYRFLKKDMADEVKETLKTISALYQGVCNDYIDTFQIMKNGTIKATNKNCEKIRKFLEKYQDILRGQGFDLGEIKPLEPAKFSETKKRNENKVKILKLFGIASQLYLSSCRILRIQPNHDYVDVIIIDN